MCCMVSLPTCFPPQLLPSLHHSQQALTLRTPHKPSSRIIGLGFGLQMALFQILFEEFQHYPYDIQMSTL